MKEYCGALSKALLLNLTHQQQKIRLSALQAIGAIVPLNVTVLKETLPCIARLNVDRAHQLREEVSRQTPAILHPKHSITYTRAWLTCMAHTLIASLATLYASQYHAHSLHTTQCTCVRRHTAVGTYGAYACASTRICANAEDLSRPSRELLPDPLHRRSRQTLSTDPLHCSS